MLKLFELCDPLFYLLVFPYFVYGGPQFDFWNPLGNIMNSSFYFYEFQGPLFHYGILILKKFFKEL